MKASVRFAERAHDVMQDLATGPSVVVTLPVSDGAASMAVLVLLSRLGYEMHFVQDEDAPATELFVRVQRTLDGGPREAKTVELAAIYRELLVALCTGDSDARGEFKVQE